jgi:cell division protein FtsI/penicillin-binding protein 2
MFDYLVIFCDRFGRLYAFDVKKFVLYEEIEREKEKEKEKKNLEAKLKEKQKIMETKNLEENKNQKKKLPPVPPPSILNPKK